MIILKGVVVALLGLLIPRPGRDSHSFVLQLSLQQKGKSNP